MDGGRERGREGWMVGGRKGGRDGWWEGGREGGRDVMDGERVGGRQRKREGKRGREGGRVIT